MPYPTLPLPREGLYIRVLTLHPGYQTAQLRGTLRTVSLDAQPSYEALSYTWGESLARPEPTILLNDECELQLTDNLHAALRRLRPRFWTRDLWIDALCIDQTDLEERSRQVSIMGAVYRSAWRVCVWSGDVPDAWLLQRWIVNRLPLGCCKLKFNQRRLRWLPHPRSHFILWIWRRVAVRLLRRLGNIISIALCQMHPPWHTRVWVYPELSNAKELVWCFGPYTRTDHPAALARFLMNPSPAHLQQGNNIRGDSRRRDLADLLMNTANYTWRDRPYQFEHVSLLQNAANTSKMQATDLRDKVFSLIGVTRPQEAQFIRPDYSKSVPQVFAEATFAVMEGSGNLGALFYADGVTDACEHVPFSLRPRHRIENLPTWAVDFTSEYVPIGWPLREPWRNKVRPNAGPSRLIEDFTQPILSPCLLRLHLQVLKMDTIKAAVGGCSLIQNPAETTQHTQELQEQLEMQVFLPQEFATYTAESAAKANEDQAAQTMGQLRQSTPGHYEYWKDHWKTSSDFVESAGS